MDDEILRAMSYIGLETWKRYFGDHVVKDQNDGGVCEPERVMTRVQSNDYKVINSNTVSKDIKYRDKSRIYSNYNGKNSLYKKQNLLYNKSNHSLC